MPRRAGCLQGSCPAITRRRAADDPRGDHGSSRRQVTSGTLATSGFLSAFGVPPPSPRFRYLPGYILSLSCPGDVIYMYCNHYRHAIILIGAPSSRRSIIHIGALSSILARHHPCGRAIFHTGALSSILACHYPC